MRCSKGVVLANVLFQFGATDVDLDVMCSTLLVTKCSAHAHRQSPKVEGRSPKEEGRRKKEERDTPAIHGVVYLLQSVVKRQAYDSYPPCCSSVGGGGASLNPGRNPP